MSLTTAEAAPALGISEAAVRKLVERGQLEPIRRGTRPLRFHEATVAALLPDRWRRQQHASRSQVDDAWAEIDELVAAQVSSVSRCGQRQSPPCIQVEGG